MSMLPCMTIGDEIRAARKRQKLSQRVLAEKIGVDKSAVAQWEGGGTGTGGIRTENLIEAARILQVKPSQLLGEPSEADTLVVSDTREITVVSLFRVLSEELKDVHLRLLYAQTGDLPKEQGSPRNRKRIGRERPTKQSA